MIHQVPTPGIEKPDQDVENRKRITTRRAVMALALVLAGCSNAAPNPFNIQVTYDATADDASDGAVQDTTPPAMDGPKPAMDAAAPDTPDSPQMDAAAEEIAPMDASSVDAPTLDVSDTSNETPTTDAPADITNEVATVDASAEDVARDAGLDVGDSEPDAPTEDRRDAQDDQDDNGPDIELIDAGDTVDAIDVIDRPDTPTPIDLPNDFPSETGRDVSSEAETGADAGTVTEITYNTAPLPTCNRVIVEGIPGCLPGAANCTYSLAARSCVRYVAERVTIPLVGVTRIHYTFTQMLNGPFSQTFPVPNTNPCGVPTAPSGTYPIRLSVVMNNTFISNCFGPTLTVIP